MRALALALALALAQAQAQAQEQEQEQEQALELPLAVQARPLLGSKPLVTTPEPVWPFRPSVRSRGRRSGPLRRRSPAARSTTA